MRQCNTPPVRWRSHEASTTSPGTRRACRIAAVTMAVAIDRRGALQAMASRKPQLDRMESAPTDGGYAGQPFAARRAGHPGRVGDGADRQTRRTAPLGIGWSKVPSRGRENTAGHGRTWGAGSMPACNPSTRPFRRYHSGGMGRLLLTRRSGSCFRGIVQSLHGPSSQDRRSPMKPDSSVRERQRARHDGRLFRERLEGPGALAGSSAPPHVSVRQVARNHRSGNFFPEINICAMQVAIFTSVPILTQSA